jgi:uncharacterized protein (UPF0305 family)
LDCEICPVFIAAKNDDNALRAKTAQEFSELYAEYLGGQPVEPEDVNCSGCPSKTGLFTGCILCPIRKCCQEKKLTTCARCIDFQQCEMLTGFYNVPAHSQAKENLDHLRA